MQADAVDIGSDELKRYVYCPQALQAASDYIKGERRTQGCSVERQVYQVHGVSCANLEITVPGHSHDAGIILLGAHYDSVRGGPGANDNGSGVAADTPERLDYAATTEVTRGLCGAAAQLAA